MEEGKVKLRMPIYTYDASAIQEYLRKEAREGLFVTKFGRISYFLQEKKMYSGVCLFRT